MAENSSSNNSYLFLEDGITIPNLPLLVLLVYNGVGVLLPLVIVGSLFYCCRKLINYHVKRCPHCTSPRSIRARCKNSTIGRMTKFCNVIEQFTAWLLVDLFHTPKVEKVLIRGKLRLTVAKRQVQNTNTFSITAVFFYISTLFCLYIAKVILDIFVKITPTCINEGDFGFPAFCYADLSGSDHQINCTTWNEHSDLLEEATGSLLCVSLFYNFLTTLAELAGLYGLQEITVQIMLLILGKFFMRKRGYAILILLILNAAFILLVLVLPFLMIATEAGNHKMYHKILHQQFPTMSILGLSLALPAYLFWSTNNLIDPGSKFTGMMPMSKTEHGRPCDCATKRSTEKQSDGETDILVTGEIRQEQSTDEIKFETTQGEDVTSVEIHDYTTEEACTSREHNEEGLLEGHGNIQMEFSGGCSITRDIIYT